MTDEMLSLFSSYVLLGLLVTSLGIFGVTALKSKSVRSFQFQLSVFIVIWITGEIIELLVSKNFITIEGFEHIGMQVHLAAMVLFCIMLWLRFYYSKMRGSKMVETPDFYND
jgi:hypothetical protein